ncbi:class I SAM-dependent methyltransferase [Zophobihabitans entericus]|uniref:Class I SAM-dependent methyltransferase n=1 Tax=Zophobihabitans entericus TaxID=1635327 RepID=A0A6G9IAR5_9GAMM|nr:class I SAM-dependent methyltransferase [Zophobihabitans entericus]QIQ20927.1 class I SAM-dependent methyltransferase [Zophobihabitans entericus]
MSSSNHHDKVDRQFGEQAQAYLTSQVHAKGNDLDYLTATLKSYPDARVLDMGCGAGHVSFIAAQTTKEVVAYDLSTDMLNVVAAMAKERQYHNLSVTQGIAEKLPFPDQSFDIVLSRYSAHHWQDVGKGMREAYRVLKPGGKIIIIDVVSPGHPVFDIWLQTVEALRDTSHVRDYTPGEWMTFFTESGFIIDRVQRERLPLNFATWITRMRTPEHFVKAVRAYQQSSSQEVNRYFELQEDGSFTSDLMIIEELVLFNSAFDSYCLIEYVLSGQYNTYPFEKYVENQILALSPTLCSFT